MASSSSSVFLVLLICVAVYYFRVFMIVDDCPSKDRIDGQTVIVTGANSGIGRETARELVKRGAAVVLACRSEKRCAEAVKDIADDTKQPDKVTAMNLDLSSFMSIRAFAAEFKNKYDSLDILVNNAGMMMPEVGSVTEDGFEPTMGVNHLGHFLLTNLLVDKMLTSNKPARILTVSSESHRIGGGLNVTDSYTGPADGGYFSGSLSYARSKVANILFTRELAKKLEGTKITTYAISPGFVMTHLFRNTIMDVSFINYLLEIGQGFYINSPYTGAQTSVCCAVDKDIGKTTGKYYHNCRESSTISAGADDEAATALWENSAKLTNLQPEDMKWMRK